MAKAVAEIKLDSRAWGPAYCELCEDEIEEVVLMSDASFVCPECGTPVEGLEQTSSLFTSAAKTSKHYRFAD